MLQKEAEEIKKQLAENGGEDEEKGENEQKEDPIYAYEAEEQVVENENVYYDEHGNAIYYDATITGD